MVPAAGSRLAEPRRVREISDATVHLLVERGYDGLSVEAVAHRARVNKTTLYRWWPSKAALVAAAVTSTPLLGFDPPDTGSLRGDLRVLLRHVRHLLSTSPGADIAAALLAGAARSVELAQAMDVFFVDRLAAAGPMITRAAARGEAVAATRTEVVLDLLNGAVWVHCVVRRRPLDDALLDELIDTVLTGLRPRTDAPAQSVGEPAPGEMEHR